MEDRTPAPKAVQRMDIPNKARNRHCVPWRLTIGRELDQDQMQALVSCFLSETTHHYVLAGDVYPGMTMITGDYWAARNRGKDMAQVARRWDEVYAALPELMPDAVIEYRVPSALLDDSEPLDISDLTRSS